MKSPNLIRARSPARSLVALLAVAVCARSMGESVTTNRPIELGDRSVTVTKLESLPYVESEYSKRFKFDSFGNPRLKELREGHHLDQVIAPGRDEFDKQVLLMDWTHQQFKRFGRPSTNSHGALQILKAIDEGHTFYCSHYAEVLVSAAASLGWVDRPLALRRHQGVNKVGGSTEHSVTEIWSNQHRKWVMLDPTSNMYLEKDGVPLNANEIRNEWFYRDGTNLVFVVGKERKKYRKSALPIFLGRFAGFGDLTVEPDELDKYGFIGYIPNTDLMDSGYDYAKMFIVKDRLCDGTQWHVRTVPSNPAVDPYFPIDQAALDLRADNGNLGIDLKTMTPNFDRFEIRIDQGGWKSSTDHVAWKVHPGPNRFEARTVNLFGVTGPVSSVEVESKE
ncbi:MAG TPA: transglutaminase domain-containing protein [Candidatus Nitrosotalea sp.]|nr:transglutaminase domain-containing protein [Candidatus Nitrosotalea sp.]